MDHPLVSGEGMLWSLPDVMTPRAERLETIREKGFNPNGHVAGEASMDDSLSANLRKLTELEIDGKAPVFSSGSAQVPMIKRWPKEIPADQVCEEVVQHIDLTPTFLISPNGDFGSLPNRWAESHTHSKMGLQMTGANTSTSKWVRPG